jgi:hypothetical protein
VDAVGFLGAVLVILASLVVADLLLSTVFVLMDLADPGRRSLFALRSFLPQGLSDPGAQARSSRD